mmetsp:Transcript_13695/g.23354  ORF Transcript_13695/g.23354 Transcript_13695/m.23354 type:complete len:82 (-) Transcript_13695:1498-1743(-)
MDPAASANHEERVRALIDDKLQEQTSATEDQLRSRTGEGRNGPALPHAKRFKGRSRGGRVVDDDTDDHYISMSRLKDQGQQ